LIDHGYSAASTMAKPVQRADAALGSSDVQDQQQQGSSPNNWDQAEQLLAMLKGEFEGLSGDIQTGQQLARDPLGAVVQPATDAASAMYSSGAPLLQILEKMIKEKKTITLPFGKEDISTAESLYDLFGADDPGSSSSSGEARQFITALSQFMGQADQLTQVSGQLDADLEEAFGPRK
jgi:hypothetical protein